MARKVVAFVTKYGLTKVAQQGPRVPPRVQTKLYARLIPTQKRGGNIKAEKT